MNCFVHYVCRPVLCYCLLQYRDLPADTYLSLSVYELSEGRPMLLVGSTSMPMFSKKGRLKTGQQQLQVQKRQAGREGGRRSDMLYTWHLHGPSCCTSAARHSWKCG